MLTGDIPPNQTIYVKNLNEKVKKEGILYLLYFNVLPVFLTEFE
jgi:U2 small nuclear ribonucleoprotein B''